MSQKRKQPESKPEAKSEKPAKKQKKWRDSTVFELIDPEMPADYVELYKDRKSAEAALSDIQMSHTQEDYARIHANGKWILSENDGKLDLQALAEVKGDEVTLFTTRDPPECISEAPEDGKVFTCDVGAAVALIRMCRDLIKRRVSKRMKIPDKFEWAAYGVASTTPEKHFHVVLEGLETSTLYIEVPTSMMALYKMRPVVMSSGGIIVQYEWWEIDTEEKAAHVRSLAMLMHNQGAWDKLTEPEQEDACKWLNELQAGCKDDEEDALRIEERALYELAE